MNDGCDSDRGGSEAGSFAAEEGDVEDVEDKEETEKDDGQDPEYNGECDKVAKLVAKLI
jgi:hypothetical protein